MTNKYILGGLAVGALLGTLAFFNVTPFRTILQAVTQQFGASPAGSNFSTSKVAQQTVTTATSTVFAQTNNDSNDRSLVGAEFFMTGGTTATTTNLEIKCATSSVATGFSVASPNFILDATINSLVGNALYGTTTGSGVAFMASTSPGLTGTTTTNFVAMNAVNAFSRVWASGSNLVCELVTSNGSNTNLLPAGTNGYIAFPYRGQ